jgi:hypothetical protein
MKRTLLTLTLAMLGAFTFSQEQTTIAIFPFEDRDNVLSIDESDSFYGAFRNEFTNKSAGSYTVIPRHILEKLNNTTEEFQFYGFLPRLATSKMFEVFSSLSVTHIIYVTVINNTITKLVFDDDKSLPNTSICLFLYLFPELEKLSNFVVVGSKDELFNKIPDLVQSMMKAIA